MTTPDNSAQRVPLWQRLLKAVVALAVGIVVGWAVQQAVHRWQAREPGAMQTWLLIAGQAHDLDQVQVSLPSGSRFQLQIRSPFKGLVSLSAPGAAGAAPLWSGPANAGAVITTPVLRLTGIKGRETLVVNVQPSGGQAPVSRTYSLWHL